MTKTNSASLSEKYNTAEFEGNQDSAMRPGQHPFGKLVIEQADQAKGRNVVYQYLDGKEPVMLEGVTTASQVILEGKGGTQTLNLKE